MDQKIYKLLLREQAKATKEFIAQIQTHVEMVHVLGVVQREIASALLAFSRGEKHIAAQHLQRASEKEMKATRSMFYSQSMASILQRKLDQTTELT